MAWASSSTYPSLATWPGFPPGTFTPGPADSHQLIAIINGIPVDVSADIIGSVIVKQQQRSTESESPLPATLSATLANPIGAYTPDNPRSAHWPYWVLQTTITYTVTKDGNTQTLFTGKLDSIDPTFTKSARDGTVAITASDPLGEAGSQTMRSDINERWNAFARGASGTSDVWMFGEDDGVTQFANTGYNGAGRAAKVIKPTSGRGQANREDADGLIVEGAITVTDNEGRGPIILARHAQGQKCMMVWFKWDVLPPYLPDYDVILAGRRGRIDGEADGAALWHLRYTETGVGTGIFHLELRDDTNTVIKVLDTGPGDGAWHNLFIWNSSPGTTGFYYDTSSVTVAASLDLADQEYIVCGGAMNPYINGAQTRCLTASFAALMVTTVTVGGLEPFVQSGSIMDATSRWTNLMSWRTYGGSHAIVGTDTRPVAVKSVLGRTHLDVISELATTIGGTVWHSPPLNRVELLTGPVWRPQVPLATITLELDDNIDAGHEWGLSLQDSPTRATATCPDGEGTFIQASAETQGIRDGGSFETCAASVADARSLAAWQVNRVKRLSLSRLGVDVASAVNSAALWPAMFSMHPGARLHVINIDPQIFGVSSFDVHVLGWEVEIGPEIAQWTFDCLPADSPAEYSVEDPLYGRVGWNDGEAICSVMTAASGSLTITTAGYPLSTSAGDYPLMLLIDGEVMTVPSPPASATSPQVVSVTRASVGTSPTAHPAGRSVYLYPDVRVGP